MNLTEHFTLQELTFSKYAQDNNFNNHPTDPDILANLQVLAEGMERVRACVHSPIIVSSAYRAPKTNSGVHGSVNSAHMFGLACDFNVRGITSRQAASIIAMNFVNIQYDQLILEFPDSNNSWVHISFPDVDKKPRGMKLTSIKENGKTVYNGGIS